MSQSKNARNMDESSGMGGSVRRARERAEAGIPRGRPPSIPSAPPRRPQPPPAYQGMAISRPSPVPQWPLAGPIASPASVDSEPYRPPPGRSQPPQRPPRPSRVPSILDASRIQDHTPVFQYMPQNARASEISAPETAMTSSSRPSTLSSVGSIPDFPLPVATPVTQNRRSVTLGPPPSSRRGASSFYSTVSFVSPIPEESPRSRSYVSYASSAAIPESFGTISPGNSPNDGFFDDTIAEESMSDADADESRLVRSASIGKRGKPSLVTTKSSDRSDPMLRPGPRPTQSGPFGEGTGYVENSSSSEEVPSTKGAAPSGLTAANMLNAYNGASAIDPASIRKATPSPRPFRLSGLRRPPRLDIDAVRAAEARGSMTSLPDLIRRATRLATMIDRGRRPASRFDDLDFPEEVYGRDYEKHTPYTEKHQSGLSDMLAAFPPPASRRSMRQSGNSWPLPANPQAFRAAPATPRQPAELEGERKKRRCCGLPMSIFLLILFLLLCIVAAAVVVPLELLVFNKPNQSATPEPATSDCPSMLICQNGGTNVITQGVCSCICSNGFTGADCTIPTSQGCTTTTIDQGDHSINNVTIGQAIPRLVRDGQANFSIPLSATIIMSKFNAANLSCNAENALVTFDGQSSKTQSDLDVAGDLGEVDGGLARVAAAAESAVTLTVSPDADATIIVKEPTGTGSIMVTTLTAPTTFSGSTIFATTLTYTMPEETTASSKPTPEPTSSEPTKTSQTTVISSRTTTSPEPTATFNVTREVVDFARIAVIYVLQQHTLDDASTAQTSLQTFFNDVDSGMKVEQAMNFTIGGSNTIDLVNFFVDAGDGRQGGGSGD